MPIPKPNTGEKQDDFIARCMSNGLMNEEYPDNKQRAAICYTQWKEKSVSMDNNWLLGQIRNRKEKSTSFGRGITTADAYVKTLADAAGLDVCYKRLSTRNVSFDDVLQKAAKTLVYSNDQMELEAKADSTHKYKDLLKGLKDVKLPKNTLILFRHKLTTSVEDRDKDILHSEGMELDPKMLLLWQHVHTMPIGKYVHTVSQDDKSVRVISAIVDINETSHDAAVMIDNGMGRFSHGFKATEFQKRKSHNGKETGGFEIHRAEIMEESLVSVPANPGAETEEIILSLVEGGKLTSPVMKSVGRSIREKRPLQMQGITYRETVGDSTKELTCQSFEELKKLADHGVIGTKKEKEDENLPGTEQDTERGEDTTSEETNDGADKAADNETKDTSDSQVESDKSEELTTKYMGVEAAKAYVDLPNSYEVVTSCLGRLIMEKFGQSAWLTATFTGHAIFEDIRAGKKKYYSIEWETVDGQIKLKGTEKEVELKVDVVQKAMNTLNLQKQGRVLSRANETKIQDAREDIKEASKAEGLSRSCLALLNKAFNSLGQVLKSLGSEPEPEKEITIEEAKVVFLKNSTAEDRQQMESILSALSAVDKRAETTKWFKSLK
jgi:hypothetical protein